MSDASRPMGVEPHLSSWLVDQWPMAVALIDDSWRFRIVNRAFAEHLRLPAERTIGRGVDEVLGDGAAAIRTASELVLRTGESILDLPIAVQAQGRGQGQTLASFTRVVGDGFRGVGLVAYETGERAVQAADRQLSVARARSLLMAVGEIVWSTDKDGAVVEDSPSWRAFTGQTLAEFQGSGWLDALHPNDVDATQQAWDRAIARGAVFEGEYRVRTQDGSYRLLLARAAPVQSAGIVREWAVLNVDLSRIQGLSTDKDELSARLERLGRQQTALRALAASLSEALTTQEVVDSALLRAPILVQATGALVVMSTAERGLRVLGQRDMPSEAGANWRVVPDDAEFPAVEAVRTGERVGVSKREGPGIHLDTLPFVVDGRAIGAITFAFDDSQPHDADFVEDVTKVIGQALERAQNFEREQSIAVSLQRGMLPSTLPRIDGAELGARYLPGSDEADVGGDWFESILLDDGRLLLAVGDVMGKGLPAASTMSEFRHALKALSVVSSSPAELLGFLARYHDTRSGDKDQLLTLVIALVDHGEGSITWASAGHIPPLVTGPEFEGATFLDEAQGLPLGLGVTWTEGKCQLSDGDALMLVSDGLVEDRRRSLVDGLDALESAFGSLSITSAAQACDGLIDQMIGNSARDDDVTTLCLRIDKSITAAGWTLTSKAQSVPTARGKVEQELMRLGVDDPEVIDTVKLLTSELVTNAIRYSDEDLTVCLDRVDRLIRVTVVDTNPDIRLEPKPIEVQAQHGRGLLLVETLATDWGVVPEGSGKQVWFELEMGL